MGVFCKIFVEFTQCFWDKTKDIHHFIYIKNEKKGHYPNWRPIANSNVMMAIVTGDEARRIERQSDDETLKEIHLVIRNAFGGGQDQNDEKFRPKKIHVCRWDTDPRFYGSYSNHKIKAFLNENGSLKKLNAPLKDRNTRTGISSNKVYFAGEAHSEKYNGYLQGAYVSGEITAN